MQETESPRSARPLDLGELVDLELRLLEDRSADPGELRRRDAAIAAHLFPDGPPQSRHETLRAWLEALRGPAESTSGRKLQAIYRIVSWCLLAGGFLGGASAAGGLLYYDGNDPVNVISYLAVFVLLQLALCLLTLSSMLPAAVRGRFLRLGPLQAVIRELGFRRAGIEALLSKIPHASDAHSGKLLTWSRLYGEAERWRLLSITQRAGVAFQLGALATSFAMVATSALAFSWSTTLEVSPETMHRFCAALALPWGWLPSAVPSLALVEASRYFPGGRYDPAVLKDWWPFLLAALTTYGLIPRLLLWSIAERRAYGLRAGLALDHGDARLAYDRLTRASSGWSGDVAADSDAADGSSTRAAIVRSVAVDGPCDVYVWGDAPIGREDAAALIARRFDCALGEFHTRGDRQTASAHSNATIVLAEAWEAPTRALCRWLVQLRGALGERRMLVVALLGEGGTGTRVADAGDFVVWRNRLNELGDPFLFVDGGDNRDG